MVDMKLCTVWLLAGATCLLPPSAALATDLRVTLTAGAVAAPADAPDNAGRQSTRPAGLSLQRADAGGAAEQLTRTSGGGASAVRLQPLELSTVIANEYRRDAAATMQPSLSDAEVEAVRTDFDRYRDNLTAVKRSAEESYEKLRIEDGKRKKAFVELRAALQGKTARAVSDAAKAEVAALLARLDRIQLKEVAMMDRSATYWEARAAAVREQVIVLEKLQMVTKKLEAEHSLEENEAEQLEAEGEKVLQRDQERLDSWLNDLRANLTREADAAGFGLGNVSDAQPSASWSASALKSAALHERTKARALQEVAKQADEALN
eukprot:TRINITY_DN33790_c0_g1_i1.p1 TRINITY_DN33790_c0_g1~~TRINITY_DN33790_c0_g1_i1.p1  ORF type:complete len:321 (+),score=108.65 TRINITY_DN33790_c0_g1_i1:107-1069(+)